MKTKIITLTLIIVLPFLLGERWGGVASAQSIGINSTGAAPNTSALLDIDAAPTNNKGLLLPRLSTVERNAIVAPAQSLLIYNTTDSCYQGYIGTQWISFGCVGSGCTVPLAVTASVAPNPICEGSTLTLTGAATGATVWSWAGPNSFTSTSQSSTITNITTAGAGVYTLTASNTCGSTAPVSTVSVSISATPSTAAAGSDINPACGVTIATLAGNSPTVGIGVWSVVSGTATITTPTSPTSGVTGLVVPGTATLRWTISNSPCTPSIDDVVITTTSCSPPPCSSTEYQFLTTIGLLNDGGNYGYSAIQKTDECRFLLSGLTNDYGAGGNDIMLTNINPAGAVQWVKTIGGTLNEGTPFLKNHSAGYYLGGSSASWGWSGKSALFVTNFDAAHSIVWTKVIGNATEDINLVQMSVAPDGSIYLLGEIFYTAGIIIKLDNAGNLLWSRRINNKAGCSTCSDYYQDAIATSDNGIAITGWSWSYRMVGAGNRQTIAVKFASNGNLDWAKIIGTGATGLGGLDSYGITQASDNGYVITNGGPSHLLKLNSTGGFLWSKANTDGGFFTLQKIIATSDGGFFGAGVSTVWHPNSRNTRTQMKFDSNGNILWTRVDNDISDGHPNPWELDVSPIESDDGYLTAGYSHRHTDAYAETTMSLQKYSYTGNTCLSNTVTANFTDYLLIQINDITADVQSNMIVPAFSTASPAITPAIVSPNNWTDCSQ